MNPRNLLDIYKENAATGTIGCRNCIMIYSARKLLQRNVLSPWKVLKAINLAGGFCNNEGIEVLQELESDGKCYLIPSTTEFKRSAKELEVLGNQMEPFTEVPTNLSNLKKPGVFCLVFDNYQVTEKANKEKFPY